MASFTGVGDNTTIQMTLPGEDVTIAISGTYDMTIALQLEKGSPGSGAWVTLKSWDTANATVAYTHTTTKHNEKLRLIVLVDTSGTATATLTDATSDLVSQRKGEDGEVVFEAFQGGGFVPRSVPVAITADTTLTKEQHAGRIIVFNDADGASLTLPAASGTGHVYRFFVGVTVTSNNDVIKVANATDEFLGTLLGTDADTADTPTNFPALDADGFDTITMNGSTKGGIKGDYIEIEDVAAGIFSVRGVFTATGAIATPFSAAVS